MTTITHHTQCMQVPDLGEIPYSYRLFSYLTTVYVCGRSLQPVSLLVVQYYRAFERDDHYISAATGMHTELMQLINIMPFSRGAWIFKSEYRHISNMIIILVTPTTILILNNIA